MDYFEELIVWIKENKPSKDALSKKKTLLCKSHKRKTIPTDIEVLMNASVDDINQIRPYLATKPTRTGSGVAVVATMTAPFACPHGSCTYCPGGPGSAFGDTPKSYTGKEPSTMRGARHDYDPYRIIFNRLEQYIVMGQNPDKVDQIIMGGTFCALPKSYQEQYVYYSFKAYNDFSDAFYDKNGNFDLVKFKDFFELPGKVGDNMRAETIKQKVLALKSKHADTSLEDEQVRNESAFIRCIGLTIETKPDWGRKEHGLQALRLGATRIELGLQTLNDDILTTIHRGHTLQDSIDSIRELKDLGFKINAHMMPGLPGINGKRISKEKDVNAFKELFANPNFRPDMLKIYPCMVMPGTALEKNFEQGVFLPLTTAEAAEIIVEALKVIPEYCRLMRVQRDIPTYATTGGVDKTNLRQYVDKLAKEHGVKSRDIRAREVGPNNPPPKDYQIDVTEYEASLGKEFFIQATGQDKLLGFVRLRFPSSKPPLHPSITENSALIRELHVYGTAVAIGDEALTLQSQHKGVGKSLMKQAETIAKQHGKDKIIVISGVGVRGYYEKLGYTREAEYMTKSV